MQKRAADSRDALFPSLTCATQSATTSHHGDSQVRVRYRCLLGQLLGLVFWTAISISLCCWYSITGVAAQSADPNNILLDFSAQWCRPCQKMSPIVSSLERQGFSIRKVDIDVEKELANRYNIQGIPCFVLIANGREVERISGATDERTLRAMLAKLPKSNDADASTGRNGQPGGQMNSTANAGTTAASDRKSSPKSAPLFAKNNESKLTPTDSGDTFRAQNASQEIASESFVKNPLTASARIKVTVGKDIRYGSGTIIESEPGHSVVLTCGHILRGYRKNGLIEVDCYPAGKSKPQTFVGKVIDFDPKSDLGLLEIASQQRLPAMKIGVASKSLAVKDRVVSVGCGGGESPSSQNHFVTALNRWEGPDTVECSGEPEQGRSGGGLFLGSELVGVCILADRDDKRGIYTGLKPVIQMLAKSNFGHLVPTLTPVEETIADSDPLKSKVASDIAGGGNDDPLRRSHDEFAELLQEAPQDSGNSVFDSADYVGAEIVCIVRPKTPGAISRIVVVNEATSRFVDDLLRDSTGGSRSASRATVQATPRKTPSERARAKDGAMSALTSEAKRSAVEDSLFDDQNIPVETSFEPRRSARKQK